MTSISLEDLLQTLKENPEWHDVIQGFLTEESRLEKDTPSLDNPTPDLPVWSSTDEISALYRTDALTLMRSMPENSVDCIWTDPPYLLSNGGIYLRRRTKGEREQGEWDHSRGLELTTISTFPGSPNATGS